MRKRMTIEQMLFPDGEVEEYEFNNDELKLIFRDSNGINFLLKFGGSLEVKEQGSVGLSVYQSHLDQDGDRAKLRLLDDDLKEMLTIRFRVCQIEATK